MNTIKCDEFHNRAEAPWELGEGTTNFSSHVFQGLHWLHYLHWLWYQKVPSSNPDSESNQLYKLREVI